ncbi:Purple acid Phosphatase, N-terminal domain [Candidatus Methanophagaceae archaeon]|nr:Purple acid Phosphatase, N-terminal domain [Methanophagales archaeon]
MNGKVLMLITVFAVMLLSTASASSAIQITYAEAVYEADLTAVSVPTTAVPLKAVFIPVTADACIEQDLTTVHVPTIPLPLKAVFISATADVSIEQYLTAVNVLTSPVPIKRIFIHNEDAKSVEELLYPKGLIKDFIAPVITNVTVTDITNSSAVIKWDTDEIADSVVKYGTTSQVYTGSVKETFFVEDHAIELTGLDSDTTYYFVINSTDRSGNSAESAEYSFSSSGSTPTPTPTPTPATSIFDTGSGTYPSIPGTHNGTIKPNQAVKVSKLYTYPCPRTGGHSEYMKIWNNSDWNVTARWDGYKEDWRNISFDSNFTLEAGENYSYTLKTGSYPQIHHTGNLSTSTGFITCSEFVDANGKRYDKGIPAIRLWA